eukprot:m.119180 g.119180  ORF g.119180 m.119180 type:complete len:644 (-) comp52044_c0_seq1:2-1933(-)
MKEELVGVRRDLLRSVLLENTEGLVDFAAKGNLVLEQVQQVAVVHLQEHACQLASLLRIEAGDDLEEVVSQDLLLVLSISGGEGGSQCLHVRLGLGLLGRSIATRHVLLVASLRGGSGATLVRVGGLGCAVVGELLATAAHALRTSLALVEATTHERLGNHERALRVAGHHGAGGESPILRLTETAVRHHHVGVHVGEHALHALHALRGHTVAVLLGQVLTTLLLALRKGDVQRLVDHEAAVHLSHGTSGIGLLLEADEAEPTGLAALVEHDLGVGEFAVGGEAFAELRLGVGLGQVLDVQVHTLGALSKIGAALLVLAAKHAGTLVLLHGSANVDELAIHLGVVRSVHGSLGIRGRFEADEAKALALVGIIVLATHDGQGGDLAEASKKLLKLDVRELLRQVLDEDVGEVQLGARGLLGTILAVLEGRDGDLLVLQESAVGLRDSILSRLRGLELHKATALALTTLVEQDLARRDVAKDAESIVELLVVDGLLEALDEDVANTRSAERGVALAPHDAAGAAENGRVVVGVQGTLSILRALEVHVGVAQRTTSHRVAAHADGGDGADVVEGLVQDRLSDIGGEVANVERGRLRARNRRGSGSLSFGHCRFFWVLKFFVFLLRHTTRGVCVSGALRKSRRGRCC